MLATYPYHLYNAVNQLSVYKNRKATLKSDEALVVGDFAENFTCTEAIEVQSLLSLLLQKFSYNSPDGNDV